MTRRPRPPTVLSRATPRRAAAGRARAGPAAASPDITKAVGRHPAAGRARAAPRCSQGCRATSRPRPGARCARGDWEERRGRQDKVRRARQSVRVAHDSLSHRIAVGPIAELQIAFGQVGPSERHPRRVNAVQSALMLSNPRQQQSIIHRRRGRRPAARQGVPAAPRTANLPPPCMGSAGRTSSAEATQRSCGRGRRAPLRLGGCGTSRRRTRPGRRAPPRCGAAGCTWPCAPSGTGRLS